MDENELTVKQAYEFLGISRQALDGQVKRGKITKHKRAVRRDGTNVFFLRADVEALRNAEAPAPAPYKSVYENFARKPGKRSKMKPKGAK